MSPKLSGNLFTLMWILAAILYDIPAAMWTVDATISDTLRGWVQFSPLVLIPLGGLLWHLFGPDRRFMLNMYAWDPLLCLVAGAVLYELSGIGSLPPIGPPQH